MEQVIIELAGLTKKYGSFTAVDDLTLTIKKGEIFGLLGPNGAGKSTAILMMLGLTEPTSGTVRVCGIDSTFNPIEVKRRTGYLPEDVGFYDDLTGLGNLKYTALLNGMTEREAEESALSILERVGLANEAGKKAGKYSRGMRQRLGLADVLIKRPEVIILDEPTLGIDPLGVDEFLDLILRLSREEGHTVLLSSHHLHQVQQICDRVGLFVGGNLIAEGDVSSLAEKLFGEDAFTIEAHVRFRNISSSGEGQINNAMRNLENILMGIEGVKSVKAEQDILQIGCTSDISDEVSRRIVESGAGLVFLQRKTYGLDDIYKRYFEGGSGS